MMRLVLALVLAAASVAPARAEAPEIAPFRVGGDVSAYLREEAGGNRSVQPSLDVRGTWFPLPYAGLTFQYGVATLGPVGGVASAWSWVQRASLRVDGRLPLGPHALVVGTGPAVTMLATSIADHGQPVASTFVARPGVEGLVAFETKLGALTWRASFQGLWTPVRTDFWTGLGVDFGLGAVR